MFWTPIDDAMPRGWAICVLAYLDSSADTNCGRAAQEYVALASIAAYKEQWDDEFLGTWHALAEMNGGQPIHAAALHQSGQIEILKKAVLAVAALRPPSFHAFGCVVNLRDYARAVSLCPKLSDPPLDDRPKPAEAICVDWCVGHLFDRLDVDFDKAIPNDIGLVFDRNEDFQHWINRVWTAPFEKRPWWARKRVRHNDWLRARIGSITSGDMESYAQLQAADVIAWVIRRRRTHGDRNDWYEAIASGREADFKYYNFKRLLVEYAPDRATIDQNVSDGGV